LARKATLPRARRQVSPRKVTEPGVLAHDRATVVNFASASFALSGQPHAALTIAAADPHLVPIVSFAPLSARG